MKSYSFRNGILLVNGVEITGWDEGDDVLSIERSVDSAQHIVGAQGEMVVSLSTDRSGTFTFRLQQTSTSNLFMLGLLAAQEEGIFVPTFIQYKDTQGGDLVSGTQGYVMRPANMVRGVNAQPQEWAVTVETLTFVYGAFGDIVPIQSGVG